MKDRLQRDKWGVWLNDLYCYYIFEIVFDRLLLYLIRSLIDWLPRETKNLAYTVWHNIIFPVWVLPVTEGNVKIKSEEILKIF